MVALSCPHCGNVKEVIRFGTNRSGTARCRCLACKKTFTLSPKSRTLSPVKQATIEGALAERISQQGIAGMLQVSRNTVRRIRKRGKARREPAAGWCPGSDRRCKRDGRTMRAAAFFFVALGSGFSTGRPGTGL